MWVKFTNDYPKTGRPRFPAGRVVNMSQASGQKFIDKGCAEQCDEPTGETQVIKITGDIGEVVTVPVQTALKQLNRGKALLTDASVIN